MNAIIIIVFKYAFPVMIDANINLIQKLNTLLTKNARGQYCIQSFKWNTTKIMKELKWYAFYQIPIIEALTFIHKCIFENLPISINNLLCFILNRTQIMHSVRKVRVKDPIESSKVNQTLIYW